jgi:hypothetical protein
VSSPLQGQEDSGSPLAKFPLTKSNKLLTKNIGKITVEELNHSSLDFEELDQFQDVSLRSSEPLQKSPQIRRFSTLVSSSNPGKPQQSLLTVNSLGK